MIKTRAQELRKNMTEAEKKLWHHLRLQHAEQGVYDQERTALIEGQGFRILRFWNNEVLKETEAMIEKINGALSPHLASPTRGEEFRCNKKVGIIPSA